MTKQENKEIITSPAIALNARGILLDLPQVSGEGCRGSLPFGRRAVGQSTGRVLALEVTNFRVGVLHVKLK